ncbi:hypothetical protein TNCV_1462531 [Trichonephila clavipes]|nr:hypothetical protein TNCV_1462531 [Trichonephila clavipes]
MHPARWCQNEAHEINRSKALVVFLSIRSSEHQAGDNTFWFGSTPYLRQNTLQGVVRTSFLSSPSTSLTRGPTARRIFRVSPCREGTIHLQTPMPTPEFEPRSQHSS